MSKAKLAVWFARVGARDKFPDDAEGMSKIVLGWLVSIGVDASYGTHKYIPTSWLNEQLGLPDGAGIYGFYRFDDGSYALLTCRNGVIAWNGSEGNPEFDK